MQKPLVFFGLSCHFLIQNKKIIVSNDDDDDDDDNDNKDWTATEKYAIRNSQNFREGA